MEYMSYEGFEEILFASILKDTTINVILSQ